MSVVILEERQKLEIDRRMLGPYRDLDKSIREGRGINFKISETKNGNLPNHLLNKMHDWDLPERRRYLEMMKCYNNNPNDVAVSVIKAGGKKDFKLLIDHGLVINNSFLSESASSIYFMELVKNMNLQAWINLQPSEVKAFGTMAFTMFSREYSYTDIRAFLESNDAYLMNAASQVFVPSFFESFWREGLQSIANPAECVTSAISVCPRIEIFTFLVDLQVLSCYNIVQLLMEAFPNINSLKVAYLIKVGVDPNHQLGGESIIKWITDQCLEFDGEIPDEIISAFTLLFQHTTGKYGQRDIIKIIFEDPESAACMQLLEITLENYKGMPDCFMMLTANSLCVKALTADDDDDFRTYFPMFELLVKHFNYPGHLHRHTIMVQSMHRLVLKAEKKIEDESSDTDDSATPIPKTNHANLQVLRRLINSIPLKP